MGDRPLIPVCNKPFTSMEPGHSSMNTGTTAKTVEVNGHTTRCTSPMVSWSKLVSGWRA